MSPLFTRTLPLAILGLAGCAPQVNAAPTVTKLVQTNGRWQLIRGGQPYIIKGAGGSGDMKRLRDIGGNSNRTWGADNIEGKLDEAQKLGMSITVGIWLGHTEHGFDYSNEGAVEAQFQSAKAAIDRYKDHPAVLAWGIGNEMEGYKAETDPKMWAAVQKIAAYAHKVDPNHPTMTVVAEIGGDKVGAIHKYCPDIDIVGINTYAGAQSIPERYAKAGGTKPYVLTEFGPPGQWEAGKNEWGAAAELSSTAKAKWYADAYQKAIANQPLALGGYAFTWGNKQEATATWFGMLLPDGSILGAADAMTEAWTGAPPKERVPAITELKLESPAKVAPGTTVKAVLAAMDPDKDTLKVDWVLQYDPASYGNNGDAEVVPPTYPDAIVKASATDAEVKMPPYGGGYRLFAYAHDGKGGAAVANVSLFVDGGEKAPPPPAPKSKLPLEIYGEGGDNAPYIPSGYMGNYSAIKMTPDSPDNPHTGKTALKVQYTANDNWGGVVWQSPANDWGDKPGGHNVSGAKKLTFWARGAKGGETVTFGYGLIGNDKKYFDSGKGVLDKVSLTTDWKQYSIDLNNQDLTRIKSGFYWTLGSAGEPITFYLDDIKFE